MIGNIEWLMQFLISGWKETIPEKLDLMDNYSIIERMRADKIII